MVNSKEWQGTWHMVEQNISLQGTLKYDPKEGSLLIASKENFSLGDLNLFKSSNSISIITGRDYSTGENITLFNSIITNLTASVGIKVKIVPNYFIEGNFYTDSASKKYNRVSILFEGVGPWLGISGLDKQVHPFNRGKILELSYNRVETLKYNINTDLDINFHFSYNIGPNHENLGYTVEEIFPVHFDFNSDKDINVIMSWVEHYRRLFCIFFDQLCFIKEFKLYRNGEDTIENHYLYYKSISKYFPNDQPLSRFMLYNFNESKDYLLDILKKWYNYHTSDDLDYVCYVLSKEERSFSEDSFLEIARSLEVFIENLSNRTIYTLNEKSKIKSAILSKIKIEDLLESESANKFDRDRFHNLIQKLTSTVDYTNTFSYRKKVSRSLNEIKKSIDPTIYDTLLGDIKDLPETIVNCRNYYTHYDKESKSKLNDEAFNIEYLRILTKKIKMIMTILLFKDLGFTANMTANKIKLLA